MAEVAGEVVRTVGIIFAMASQVGVELCPQGFPLKGSRSAQHAADRLAWGWLPKVHLHIHLEDSVRFSTVCEEGARHGLLPPPTHGQSEAEYSNSAPLLQTRYSM